MTGHTYRRIAVPVDGGELTVGVWDPTDAAGTPPTVLAVHGVTSSHLAWPFVIDTLPGVRVIAPDLRGRGLSNTVTGPAGMRAHANDLARVLDALACDRVSVVGHSMGGFVGVVFAHLHPQRVRSLVLIDGGLPLNVPPGLDPDTLVAAILGPTAERLSTRWSGVQEYTEAFWRPHPALAGDWSAELEAYIAYDLVPEGDVMRPATSYAVTREDTIDLNTGSDLPEALQHLPTRTFFITVPRGLQNELPGLYAPDYLDRLLAAFPTVSHTHLDDLNHYTVVMSKRGARAVAPIVRLAVA